MSFPYWPGAPISGGGAPSAPQTLTYTAATNTLGISAGNSVVITPTNLSLPGTLGVAGNTTLSGTLGVTGLTSLADANITGPLQTGGGFSAILNGGFTANQPSIITRPVGNDAVLQLQNSTGSGVALITQDLTGITTISAVSGGAVVPLSQRLIFTAAGATIIINNNIIAAPTTILVGAGGDMSPGALAGTITGVIPNTGTAINISQPFITIPGNHYRFTMTIFNSTSTATTGTTNIAIFDNASSGPAGGLQQGIFSRSSAVLATNSEITAVSGIFVPNSSLCVIRGQNAGTDQPMTINIGAGTGAATFFFVIENLGGP